ncbi:MAG: hypothetical protein KF819_02125 [Labilithrix sp.]|nr:hypothetical protein [Labilithrix sp.]
MASVGKWLIACVFGVGLSAAFATACETRAISLSHCDQVVRRCRPICNYFCDSWGCYPACWESCVYDCYVFPDEQEAGPVDAGAIDASEPDASEPDATPVEGGDGGLCAACTSNADCASGGLCVTAGGAPDEDGGGPRRFCGQPCAASCPDGFTCQELGSSRQCLPNAGRCE